MYRASLLELHGVTAVAAHRNFRAAAQELGISPSALSHAISMLETRIGVRLFNRTTRSVAPTDAGTAFLDRITPALHDISAAMETANLYRDKPIGTLRINTSEDAANLTLMPIINDFLARYPDVKIDIVTEGRLIDIVADGFDAGIRLLENVPQDMIAIPVGPEQRFVVVGTPDYFKSHPAPKIPTDLTSHACARLRLPGGSIYRWEFERRGEQMRIDVNGPLTIGSSKLITEAVLAGKMLGYVIEHSVAEHLKTGRLVTCLEDWTPPFPGLHLYYPGHRHVPAALRAFIDLVKEHRRTA
ncbi:LysR family transcriptional regulator [Thalassospira sp. MCCC 1A03138]|uniref:LysR family transcriptional regulator n=1 Tax=Thalassospira sp. MCCC 1A03138 TaxID=1470576 RepID=UPI000A1E3176|nr:LysR family transcriptional regulator [Thalassospira sp. MCCC 1A03138]OSQ31181.1 LysR family transcriptional regulator [Thalassospira sp. MCCC 1A03138]